MKEKNFRSRLLRKYRLTIHNENKLENVLGFYISPLWVILSLFVSFTLVACVLYLIVVFTPVGNLFPGLISKSAKQEFITHNLRIDSLIYEVAKQDRYIANIKAIINGEERNDLTAELPQHITRDNISIETTKIEAEFAQEWEEREKYNLTSQATNVSELQELNLFRPTRGDIIRPFDINSGHFGVDIVELPGESVLAIHDGVVVMSDYTANDGFTIVIQHRENMISVYRNCHRLLKNVGDKVSGGEVIGTLGKREFKDDKDKQRFLHLELWHRGKPLDPNTYIAF